MAATRPDICSPVFINQETETTQRNYYKYILCTKPTPNKKTTKNTKNIDMKGKILSYYLYGNIGYLHVLHSVHMSRKKKTHMSFPDSCSYLWKSNGSSPLLKVKLGIHLNVRRNQTSN